MKNLILKILHLCKDMKLSFIKIQFLIILYGFVQTLTIILIKPYIDAVLNQSKFVRLDFFSIEYNISFKTFSIFYIFLFIGTTFLSIYSLREIIIFAQKIGVRLKSLVFYNFLNIPFKKYLGTSSSDVQTYVTIEMQRAISNIIQPILLLLYRLIPIIFILIFLFYLSLKFTFLILILILFLIIILISLFKKKLLNADNTLNTVHLKISKNVLETFKNIKQIKVFGLNNYFFYDFLKNINKLVYAVPVVRVIEQIIKGSIETLFIIAILGLSLINFDKSEFINHAPVISAYIFALYRILPGFQTIYSTIVSLRGNKKSIEFIRNLDLQNINRNLNIFTNQIDQKKNKEIDKKSFLNFEMIEIENLNFSYGERNIILSKNYRFKKKNVYGLKGLSGSGKTTLLDILSGLLKPDKGQFFLDKKKIDYEDYKKICSQISYSTQKTAIFNSSILENITFKKNKNEVDATKLNKIINICGLEYVLKNLKEDMDHIIVENGENFSGGQLQRIGLARCLYQDFGILMLDESTSALDKISEKFILENIIKTYKENSIIFIINHSNDLDYLIDEFIYL